MRKQYISAKQRDARYVIATSIFFFVLTISVVLHLVAEPSFLTETNASPLSFMSVAIAAIASLIPFMTDVKE